MQRTSFILASFVGLSLSTAVWAHQDVYIYPIEGQTTQHQALDENQCRNWATQQTGYIPNYAANNAGKGKVAKNTTIGVLGGAAGGAALGQVIGKKPGLGALAGATLGGFLGNLKGQKSKSEAQYAATSYNNDYNRALTACLEARGYSVS